MKYLLLLCLIITGCGCDRHSDRHYDPPYIIIVTEPIYSDSTRKYTYESASGWTKEFVDKHDAFHVGDTIK